MYPNYAWWALVYMFFCILGVTITAAADAERTYNVAVSALSYLSAIVGLLLKLKSHR